MEKKNIYIGRERWSLDELEDFKFDEVNIGGVKVQKKFLMTIDKIFYPMRYNLLDFVNKELYCDLLTDQANSHYCEIKNPYVPDVTKILNREYLPLNGVGYSVLIVCKNGKYGLIDEFCNTIIPIENDSIYPTLMPQRPYLVVKHRNLAYIYHVLKYQIVSKIYDHIEIVSQRSPAGKTTDEYLKTFKNGKCGLIHEQGREIVPPVYDDCFGSLWFGNYDDKHKYIIVTKNGKKGILNESGEEIAEIKYDKIQCSYPVGVNAKNLEAKGWINSEEFILIESGAEYNTPKSGKHRYERQIFERYNGSYAQDEMGFSDNDIDTIFEGDPDAYWNID